MGTNENPRDALREAIASEHQALSDMHKAENMLQRAHNLHCLLRAVRNSSTISTQKLHRRALRISSRRSLAMTTAIC